MEHLSPLDAGFLDAEDEDPHASFSIASVAVVEGPVPSQDEFIHSVHGWLPLVPRYRQKVRQVPFDLGRPSWVDDPGFDIGYHIRRTALPAPGDEDSLWRLIARLMSQRLDRDRPLWEIWVIEGLAEGRWAIMSKVHHCMADGIAGNELYRVAYDESPEPRGAVEDSWHPQAEPSTLRLTVDALGEIVRNPVDQVHMLARGLRTPGAFARRLVDTVRGLAALAETLIPVPSSSLTGPIGRPRRYSATRASLPDIISVAKTFNVTVNDVILAAVSGAFRTLLVERGEDPDTLAVRTLVPVSVRARDEEGLIDNRISLMLPVLPVDTDDPVTRLEVVHERLAALKARKEAEAGEAMTALARHEPFAPVSWGIRLVARLPQRNIVTVATNVPGPRRPLYALGRPIVEILPYVPIADRVRVGVSVLTYCGQASFGITTDFDSTPEVKLLARSIRDGIAELVEAARHAGATVPVAATTPPAT
jgi:diacylglycerol O-acyltransferase